MTTSALKIDHNAPAVDEPARRIRIWGAAALVATLSLLLVTSRPLEEGLATGGRSAVAEKLATVGARVEDFVPEDRGKFSRPIARGLLAGAAWALGNRLATAVVNSSWPLARAWFDRTTHKTDFMVWAGPDHFAG